MARIFAIIDYYTHIKEYTLYHFNPFTITYMCSTCIVNLFQKKSAQSMQNISVKRLKRQPILHSPAPNGKHK